MIETLNSTVAIPYGFDEHGRATAPLEAQKRFHESKADLRLYSGAFRAGKTQAGCQEAIRLCQKYPGIVGAVCRLTSPELRLTTRKTFFQMLKIWEDALGHSLGDPNFGNSEGIQGFLKSENTYKFSNGSMIYFLHLDSFEKLGSLELGFFFLDEGTELNEDIYDMLIGRLSQPRIGKRCGFVCTNPADHQNWVYKKFYKKRNDTMEVIETTTYDNPHIPDDYIERAESNFDEDYQDRYLKGIWGNLKGLVYKRWNHDKMVQEFDINPAWTIYGGQDYGVEKPAVHLVIGYDGERIYIIDEIYQEGLDSDEYIGLVEGLHKRYKHQRIYGDPSGKDTILRQRKKGIPVKKGNNAVDDGILVVKNYIKMVGATPMIVVHQRCVKTIEEFTLYKYPKVGGSIKYDKPLKENDHAMDALRYCVMGIGKGGVYIGN